MLLTILILVVLTVTFMIFINTSVANPNVIPDKPQLQIINNSVSNIQNETDMLLNEISSIYNDIIGIKDDNDVVVNEIQSLIDNINVFGFGLSPMIPDVQIEEKFESPYPELGAYVTSVVNSIPNDYQCKSILTNTFDNLLNDPNFAYNNELDYYLGNPPQLLLELITDIGNIEPYSLIKSKVYRIIDVCVQTDQFILYLIDQINRLDNRYPCKTYLNTLFSKYPTTTYNNELRDYEFSNRFYYGTPALSSMVNNINLSLASYDFTSAYNNVTILIKRLRDIDRKADLTLTSFLGNPGTYP